MNLHTLPGQGVAIADPDTKLALDSDFGYGFVAKFEALLANKKAGKRSA
jgi:topoisomerase-4 subunit A